METAKQHIFPIHYYPSSQNTHTMRTHLTDNTPNIHIYQRVENSINNKRVDIGRMFTQQENLRDKNFGKDTIAESQEERSQINNVEGSLNEGFSHKYSHFQNTNSLNPTETCRTSLFRYKSNSPLKNIHKFEIKIREYKNKGNIEVFEEEIKNNEERQDLMSKLPQLQLNQNSRPRLPPQYAKNFQHESEFYQNVPSIQNFPRVHSSKNEISFQALSGKKIQNLVLGEKNNFPDIFEVNSPINQLNSNLKTYRSIHYEENAILQNPNSDNQLQNTSIFKNDSCRPINKSFGGSTVESFKQFKDSGFTIHEVPTKQDKDIQVQILSNNDYITEIKSLKQTVKRLQKQIQHEKSNAYQKQQRIKLIENELQMTKIKSKQQMQELNQRKQKQIHALKQENEQFINSMIAQLCEKSNSELREIQARFQVMVNELKTECQQSKYKSQQEKYVLLKKIEQLYLESSPQGKQMVEKQINTDYLSLGQKIQQQKMLSFDCRNSPKRKSLDAQNHKFFQYQTQIRRLNKILKQNQNYINCIVKDFNRDNRHFQKELNEVKNNLQTVSKINEEQNQEIIKLTAQKLASKYKYILMESNEDY